MMLCELLEHTNSQQDSLCNPWQQQLWSWHRRFQQDMLFEQSQGSQHEHHTNNQHRSRSERSCQYSGSSDQPRKEGTLLELDMDCNHQEHKAALSRHPLEYSAQARLLSQWVSVHQDYQ